MSYFSVAPAKLRTIHLPFDAIRRQLRLAAAIAAIVLQCATVAVVLWAVLAAPGLITDGSTTVAPLTRVAHR